MNRRQKIIVSVTGIFLVLLLLVGLTYAYFLTRITGNTNTKSISVKTANLALVYGDGNGILEVGEVLVPGDTVKFKTASGDTVDKKTFSVTNEGNATTDYVVVIDEVKVTYTSTVEVDGVTHTAGSTTTFESNDFVYTLTCTSGCNGVDTQTVFPIEGGILVGNSIDVDEEQTYELSMTYLETGENQSNDMNKTLTARVNIKDISTLNPYSSNTGTLAYNIVNNSIVGANGTTLEATPLSGVATSVSGKNYTTSITEATATISSVSETYGAYYWTYADGYTVDPENGFTLTGVHTCQYSSCYADLKDKYLVSNNASGNGYVLDTTRPVTGLTTIYKVTTAGTSATGSVSLAKYTISTTTVDESLLSVAQDDYGTSYYYRGGVTDNYVSFANMCWRIVRIEGDGSVKMTLAAQKACGEITDEDTGTAFIGTGAYGYTYDETTSTYRINYLNYTGGMADAFKNFQTSISSYTSKLKSGDWCYDGNTYQDVAGLIPLADMSSYYSSNTSFYYGTYTRLYNQRKASLICDGTKLTNFADDDSTSMYVGALTADEVVFAGGKAGASNQNYYLVDNATDNWWWTLSPSSFGSGCGYAFRVSYSGSVIYGYSVGDDFGSLRPAVSLASGAVITGGNGTQTNPYVVG